MTVRRYPTRPNRCRRPAPPRTVRELSDVHFPEADRIRVVLDNLSTHSSGALYQAFPPCEARRVLRRSEIHYVPKHASWLNMVEIEIGVLRGQCLDRRIATPERLVSEIAAWEGRSDHRFARTGISRWTPDFITLRSSEDGTLLRRRRQAAPRPPLARAPGRHRRSLFVNAIGGAARKSFSTLK